MPNCLRLKWLQEKGVNMEELILSAEKLKEEIENEIVRRSELREFEIVEKLVLTRCDLEGIMEYWDVIIGGDNGRYN